MLVLTFEDNEDAMMNRIGAVSLCHFCHFLSLFWVQKNCCKMFDFYNSSFQVLFDFGHNHPQQIVAKAAGKCGEALYFKEFVIQCFCVLTGANGLLLFFLIVFRVKKSYLVKKYLNIMFHVISFIDEI